ncbi:MAG: flagellar export chaperone FliS [Candidatus Acidiferrales bacterium]|jgi:flagellar protein FliS
MNNPARTYRENAVRAASPVGLIVILYEEVVRSLRRAQRGIQQGNIEQRTLGLTHAVRVIGHLQSVLNFDEGGDVARNLSAFYNATRTEILRPGNASADEAIGTLAAGFSTLAETWKQVDREIGDASAPNDGAHLNPAIYSAQPDGATIYVRG